MGGSRSLHQTLLYVDISLINRCKLTGMQFNLPSRLHCPYSVGKLEMFSVFGRTEWHVVQRTVHISSYSTACIYVELDRAHAKSMAF